MGNLARFGHHPDAVIDFLVEAEEIESIAESARLALTGFGHEEDRETLDQRIWAALEFRVGGDAACVDAKDAVRAIAHRRGLNLMTEIAWPGQPLIRTLSSPAHNEGEGAQESLSVSPESQR